MKKPPYTVAQESVGCKKCKHGALFLVLDPDEIGLGYYYDTKEDAEEICRLLNYAFYQGYNRKKNEKP